MAKSLNEMMTIMYLGLVVLNQSENDDTKPPVIEDLKTMDKEFDQRLESDFKKLMRMRTYKARYKEILVLLVNLFHL